MISLQVSLQSFHAHRHKLTASFSQALTAPSSSICIADMVDSSIDKNRPSTFVNIGLQNGVLLRTILDPTSGKLTDTRTRCASPIPSSPFKSKYDKPH